VPAEPHARVDRPAHWLVAGALWIIAGFAFPFITPATNFLSRNLQQYLAAAAGMSDELAYRVAFTIVRLPLTAVLAMAIVALQCAVVSEVRPLARRWLIAAATRASVSVLIWLPTTLIVAQIAGDSSPEPVRALLLTFGAGLLAGLVSFAQRQTTRRVVTIPQRFVPTSVGAAIVGALGGWAL
jgi:hypothetical protein